MSLLGLFIFIVGMSVEFFFLVQHAQRGSTRNSTLTRKNILEVPNILAGIVIFSIFLWALETYILPPATNPAYTRYDDWAGPIMVLFLLSITVQAFASIELMPRINPQTVVLLNLLILLNALRPPWNLTHILVIAIPGLLMIVWLLLRAKINYIGQSIIYFWYLLLLLMLIQENAFLLTKVDFNLVENFIAGFSVIFLFAHAIFFFRFFFIVPSLVFPHNRPLMRSMMRQLYCEEEVGSPVFVALLLGALVIFGVDYLGFLKINNLLLNLIVLSSIKTLIINISPRKKGTSGKGILNSAENS